MSDHGQTSLTSIARTSSKQYSKPLKIPILFHHELVFLIHATSTKMNNRIVNYAFSCYSALTGRAIWMDCSLRWCYYQSYQYYHYKRSILYPHYSTGKKATVQMFLSLCNVSLGDLSSRIELFSSTSSMSTSL